MPSIDDYDGIWRTSTTSGQNCSVATDDYGKAWHVHKILRKFFDRIDAIILKRSDDLLIKQIFLFGCEQISRHILRQQKSPGASTPILASSLRICLSLWRWTFVSLGDNESVMFPNVPLRSCLILIR